VTDAGAPLTSGPTLEGLPGLDIRFSRTRRVPERGSDAVHPWHYLDTGDVLDELGVTPVGVILAVHGNPTWSYLWRAILSASLRAAEAGEPAWRVIAVDQLDMGFSARTGSRSLARRVKDLGDFTADLELDGPIVTLGHDWGGVISLGWAVDHPELLTGVIALNTAVHHPDGVPIPAPLRLAGLRGVLAASTVGTPAFLETTLALAHPPLDADVKDAFRAPYRSPARRRGIGNFVADIPADAAHPSFAELQRIASGVAALDVPALLLWGPTDPIFSDRYLDDLVDRLPHADVHRFEGAGHLIAEDRPYADAILTWLSDNASRLEGAESPLPAHSSDEGGDAETFRPLWAALDGRRDDDDVAVLDMSVSAHGRSAKKGGDRTGERRVSWRQLDDRVRSLAAGLAAMGVQKGQRVSVLVPPGPTLTAVVYACLRIGAVVVVADAGLGVRGLSRAVRGAWPDVVIGELPGLTAARALGWPGIRISVARLPAVSAKALGVATDLRSIAALGASATLPAEPEPDDLAAILFTSGSTGPAKGVAYTHRQLSALRDILAAHFDVTGETGLVTGFAPFALLGPALGTRSATPDMDVSAPRTLTAKAVAAAVRASDARIVFLSPAAILNVVATSGALSDEDRRALARVHTFLSTGAPVSEQLLSAAAEIMPNAEPHTPYGMTECLLVTDITLAGIRDVAAAENQAADDHGVCVGMPIGTNRVLISALNADGRPAGAPATTPGVLGEIVISAAHLKSSYDRLWLTDRGSGEGTPDDGRWHRTGDVGHLDADGRLWVEGRLPHILVTANGPVAPVGPEQQIEKTAGVRRAAVVGIGPRGLRQAVAVVETIPAVGRPDLANPEITAGVRASSSLPLAAVLAVPRLPTDIRHNSKIDRTRLSDWAERTLAGGRIDHP
jgi:olefin beta-lactone synthetase